MATNTYGGLLSVSSDADGGTSTTILAGAGVALPACTFVLHAFAGSGDGQIPENTVLLVKTNLYGTTLQGGTGGRGVVFRMKTDGTGYSVLHNFAGGALDGADPQEALMSDGTWLYGVTLGGGSADDGVLYRMALDGGSFSVLHSFTGGSDGKYPTGTPILTNGYLYGTARNGATGNNGVVWRCNSNGTGFSSIHAFTGGTSDATRPGAGVILIGNKLYGTAGGGSFNKGVVFRMNTDGSSYENIHNFAGNPDDGSGPQGTLTVIDSNLFGTVSVGGASGNGALFKMRCDGSGYALFHNFSGGSGDGANPWGTLTLAGGKLYGATEQGGTNNVGVIFSCDTNGAMYSIERAFAGGSADGATPMFGALVTDDMYLYGMTSYGGTLNRGIVFRLPLTPPQTQPPLSAFQLWQIGYFGSTMTSGSGPTEDSDHDGMNNYQEFIAGTNPNDANSRFAITAVAPNTDNKWGVNFDVVAGKSYTVTWKTNLLDGLGWTFYTNFTGLNGSTNVVVPDSLPQAFFKIQVE